MDDKILETDLKIMEIQAKILMEKSGIQNMLITLGSNGMLLVTENKVKGEK